MIIRKISKSELIKELVKTGVDEKAFGIIERKSETIIFKIHDIDARGANILKQEFLSKGGDVAVHKSVASFKIPRTDAILIGTVKTYQEVIKNLALEPYFELNEIKDALEKAITKSPFPLFKIRGKVFDFNKSHYIMGILNVTPDSFSDGGKFLDIKSALNHAKEMISEGADIIDIGGESTRPGAESISEEAELNRIIPVIKGLRKINNDIIISIDTYKSKIVKEALENGADLINDISGLRFDHLMVNVARDSKVPVIIMHVKGTPRDMQKNPHYDDLIRELLEYFNERINALNKAGIEKIVIDPGIGFGKNPEDNLNIIKNLSEFTVFNLPVLVGISRKSFMGLVLNEPVENRLFGTMTANAIALMNGANIIRVHDVKPHKDLIKIFEAIKNA
jgi:dihydropteroate synthase